MIRDRQLQEVTGDALMAEDGPRVFDRRADVYVAARWIVGRDRVEAARVGIIDPRRVHEAAGRRRLERRGKLADEKRAEIGGQRDQLVGRQVIDDVVLARLVGGEKVLLVLRD